MPQPTYQPHPMTPAETLFWARNANISREEISKTKVREIYDHSATQFMVVELKRTGPTTLNATTVTYINK